VSKTLTRLVAGRIRRRIILATHSSSEVVGGIVGRCSGTKGSPRLDARNVFRA
jgi:hypothetical protein